MSSERFNISYKADFEIWWSEQEGVWKGICCDIYPYKEFKNSYLLLLKVAIRDYFKRNIELVEKDTST